MAATAVEMIRPAATSWEAFERSSVWEALTPQQRLWVVEVLANGGDRIAATRVAYHCRTAKTAQILSYEVRKHPTIVAALEAYRGVPRAEFLAELRRTIRSAVDGSVAQVKAQALYARLAFGVEGETDGRPASNSEESAAAPDRKVPAGARAWVNKDGVVIGYRDADGKDVQL
jgi:hypothetical protein